MTVIKTRRNRVVADEQEPDDVVVQVTWLAPAGDGRHLKPISMPWRPISEYREAIDWAVSMADKMAHPIYVMPLGHRDILETSRFDPYRKFLASLPESEGSEVRQMLVDAWVAIMRDCDNIAVRAEAVGFLQALGVVSKMIKANY